MTPTATSIARTIILSTVVFAVLTSALWVLLFGDGLEGVPRMALAATIGGTLWGIVFASVTLVIRGFGGRVALSNNEMKQTKPAMARMARSSLPISVFCGQGAAAMSKRFSGGVAWAYVASAVLSLFSLQCSRAPDDKILDSWTTESISMTVNACTEGMAGSSLAQDVATRAVVSGGW